MHGGIQVIKNKYIHNIVILVSTDYISLTFYY